MPDRREPAGNGRQPELGRRTRGRSRWGWGLLAAGLLVLAAWLAWAGVQTLNHGRSLQAHLRGLEGLAGGGLEPADTAALQDAGNHLAGMDQDLAAIRGWLGPFLPLGGVLGWVPTYGGDLAAASNLVDAAAGVSSAGDRVFRALAPALDLFGAQSSSAPSSSKGLGERLLPVLVAARPELLAAQAELVAVRQARDGIVPETLSPRVAGLLDRLDRYLPWLEAGVDGALLAPDLLGAGGARTYLVIAQNNQELRATGGFISGVGELHVEEGRLGPLSFGDSYAVDNLAVPHDLAPADFQAVLGGQLWLFRDANWDADWPTSARRALDIYARDRGVQADGVIALDLNALQGLVDAVGPIQVEGIDSPVTGANFLAVAQEAWGAPAGGSGDEWWLHRKDFMGEIAGAAMDRLMAGQDLQPARLALALKKALDEKHLLVYLADPQAAALLRRQNWDGAVADPASTDALLVVDTNVGFNKADPNVARSIRYQVDLAGEGGPRARLTLSYQNRSRKPVEACTQEARYGESYADMMERCYWDYVRVYVPESSDLLAGPELSLPPGSLLARQAVPPDQAVPSVLEAGGRAVWTGFFVVEPLGEQALTFDYRLPAAITNIIEAQDGLVHYRLQVQKQPGTDAMPFELSVALPPGARLERAMPAGVPGTDGSSITISTDLRTDRAFEIVYRRGREEP
jgi:hypothetical protein